jgi:hypothetical protein
MIGSCVEQNMTGPYERGSFRDANPAGDAHQLLVKHEGRVLFISHGKAVLAAHVEKIGGHWPNMPDGKMVVLADGSAASGPSVLKEALDEQGLEPALVRSITQFAGRTKVEL